MKYDGKTERTIRFPPDLFLYAVETLTVCVCISQSAVLPLHTSRKLLYFGKQAGLQSHQQSSEAIRINYLCASSAKVQCVGSMFDSRGDCSPTAFKRGRKHAYQQIQSCLFHMLCLVRKQVVTSTSWSHRGFVQSTVTTQTWQPFMKTWLLVSCVIITDRDLQNEPLIETSPKND